MQVRGWSELTENRRRSKKFLGNSFIYYYIVMVNNNCKNTKVQYNFIEAIF